jgi:O-antigen/teichoic acid export membrane protein
LGRSVHPGQPSSAYSFRFAWPNGGPALNIRTISKGADALPAGTLDVGVGLMIAGVSAYGFIVVAKAALGTGPYAPLSVLWALVFTAGPGFFLPIEQEVGRAMAARRARGEGSGPLVRRAAVFGFGLLTALVLVTLAFSGKIVTHLFHGHWALLVGLILGMIGYWMGHLCRGVMSGLGRFRPYSVYVGAEGGLRFLACVSLAVIGVRSVGLYGIALGISPMFAVMLAMRNQRDVITPGPDAPVSELSQSLGALLVASVLAQGLMNAGVVAVQLLAHKGQDELVSAFALTSVVARIPLFLFQAVQAALLPKLSALAAAGRLQEFKAGFRKLMLVVSVVGGAGTLGAWVVGPMAVHVVFKVTMSHTDLFLLALGSAVYMLAISIAQALIALHSQKLTAAGWLFGTVAFVVVTALGSDLYLRVELGLLASSVAAFAFMYGAMRYQLDQGAQLSADDVLEAIHDLPFQA